jgi:hypothetical protein
MDRDTHAGLEICLIPVTIPEMLRMLRGTALYRSSCPREPESREIHLSVDTEVGHEWMICACHRRQLSAHLCSPDSAAGWWHNDR